MTSIERKFPFEAREIEPAQAEELRKYFKGWVPPSEVRYGPKGYLFPRELATIGSEIYNMKVRPDDIFVVNFPRSGLPPLTVLPLDNEQEFSIVALYFTNVVITKYQDSYSPVPICVFTTEGINTVCHGSHLLKVPHGQELVWLIANNFDFEKAKEFTLTTRYSFLDMAVFKNSEVTPKTPNDKGQEADDGINVTIMDHVAISPSPRFIKSHLPLSLLPPNLLDICKVVYVARDPRDVAVSFYHHFRLIKTCEEDLNFKTFWRFFCSDLIAWTPFFSHNQEAWEVRHHPNMLFMFYEELSKDLPTCARRVAEFLGKNITDIQIRQLCDHLNIDNFKKNKAVNLDALKQSGAFNKKESFIRNGKVGGWREYFDEEMTEQAECWIQRNLKKTDLRFPQ